MKLIHKYTILIIVLSTLSIFISTSYGYEMESMKKTMVDIKDDFSLEFSDKEILFITSNSSDIYIDTAKPSVTVNENDYKGLYSMYLSILYNDYKNFSSDVYLILEITDSNGIILDLDGLDYKEINGIKGYDITTKVGLFTLLLDKKIESDIYSKDSYFIKVHSINSSDKNYIDKTFIAEVILTEGYYKLPISPKF